MEEFRMLGERDTHQEPAVGTTLNAEPAGARDLSRDQVTRDGGEVIEDALAMRLEPGLVPGETELVAAADVCQHEDPAAFQPELAVRAAVERRLRYPETAVGIE